MRPLTSGMETATRTYERDPRITLRQARLPALASPDELFDKRGPVAQNMLIRCPSEFTCIAPSKRW
jgi:hypothetical protein